MANPKTGRRGPTPTLLNDGERAKFLKLRREGVGQYTALAKVGVGYERFKRTLNEDAEFRNEARAASEFSVEELIALRRTAAMAGDERAQEFLISRYDKGRQFAATMKARRAEIAAAAGAADQVAEQAKVIAEAAERAEKRRADRKRG